jgi:hypothetical protein
MTGGATPNDSCSNDNEKMKDQDGPCRSSPKWEDFDWTWSTESDPTGDEAISGGSSFSGYDTENGYEREEQWISCVSDSEPDLTGKDYLVQEFNFIYEVYTPTGDSEDEVLETLDNFERNLSKGVSQALGLVHCIGSETQLSVAQGAGPWLRRSLTSLKNQRFLEEDTTSGVLAVSMMPQDEIDYSSKCTSDVTTDEPSNCSPIIGGMTAWFKADGASSILNDDVFLNAVESYIKDDNSDYLGNGLLHVEYIGELNTTTYNTELDVSKSVESGSNGLSSAGVLGLALSGTFLVVGGVFGAWFVRKKRNKNDAVANEKSAADVKDDDDLQLQKTDEITSFDADPSFDVEPSNKPSSKALDLQSIKE